MNEPKKKPMPLSRETERPDYVLVVKEENLPFLKQYFDNLKVLGLEFANETGETVNFIFVKVFISEEALAHFSELYEIGHGESWVTSVFFTEAIFGHFFTNPLSDIPLSSDSGRTEAENIMIVNKVLENGRYGPRDKDFGLSKLISIGMVETAYPLHDGSIKKNGTNVRSQLYYYWSNLGVTHMEQPLDLIFRYFGNEIAFYFAWLEYFNIMLILPSIIGALVVLIGLIYSVFENPSEVKEICETSKVLCPMCEAWSNCHYKNIHKYCALAHWAFVFDNNLTIAFSIFMTFWSTIFITLWRRKENKLLLRWHCENIVEETQIRQAYLESTTHQRPNTITGEMEPYVPKIRSLLKYSVTVVTCTILLAIVASAVVVITLLKTLFTQMCQASQSLYLRSNSRMLTMILGSTVQIIVIKLFQKLYSPASIRLTKFENPRTQVDFDNSVLYKKYILSFMNNYIPLLYLAFIKGNLRTLPHNMNFLTKDSCQPINCVIDLCIQLTFIMTIKTFLGNVFSVVIPKAKACLRYSSKRYARRLDRSNPSRERLSQWEKEYYLEPLTRYSVISEFSEMVIRYGFVAFFSHAFPLAALCALMNNLIELRSDAYKFVRTHRRPVPVAKSGIGSWIGILRSLSYLSAAMNAFVIAFTSGWVSRLVYQATQGNGNLEGYLNYTLSRYATKDYDKYALLSEDRDYCYIRAFIYPENSLHEYENTETFWIDLTFKIITIFVFEHIVLVFNVILSYVIPFSPESVKQQLDLNEQRKRDVRLAECKRKMDARLQKIDLTKSLQGIKAHSG